MWILSLLAACTCPTELPERHTAVHCPDLFDPDRVPEFSVQIEPSEWAALQDEYTNWRERRQQGLPLKPHHPLIAFRYGDQVITDATIRLRGNPCCSWEGEKMQFEIDFNEIDPDGRFEGLREVVLDAPFYDPSLLRERVAVSYLEEAGVPASCANHATLTVNGELYGVYTNVEAVDKEFLERQFPDGDDAEGDLFKWDFTGRRFERQTNRPGDLAVLEELYEVDDVAGVYQAFDMEQTLAMWASEAMINQSDGYWAGSINFYLYLHPDGRWRVFPWDLDNAIDYWSARRDPFRREDYHGKAPHIDVVFADPQGRVDFAEALAVAERAHDPDVLIERIDAWDAQLRPLLELDPRRGFTMDEHDDAVESLRQHLTVRDRYVCRMLH